MMLHERMADKGATESMHLLASMELGEILLLAAVLAATSMLLIRVRRYMRRQKKSKSTIVRTDRPRSTERGHHVGLPAEAMKWEVEMHQTMRDLSAQLDSKMSALGHLIQDADRASARLETALEAPQTTDPGTSSTRGDAGPGETAIDQRVREELFTLADYGFDTREIAQRLDISIGRVELILRSRTEERR